MGAKEPTAEGFEAVKRLYTELFAASPNLHSHLVNRTVLGNKVIDHERITGRRGSSEPVELVAVYEMKDALIYRIYLIRAYD